MEKKNTSKHTTNKSKQGYSVQAKMVSYKRLGDCEILDNR